MVRTVKEDDRTVILKKLVTWMPADQYSQICNLPFAYLEALFKTDAVTGGRTKEVTQFVTNVVAFIEDCIENPTRNGRQQLFALIPPIDSLNNRNFNACWHQSTEVDIGKYTSKRFHEMSFMQNTKLKQKLILVFQSSNLVAEFQLYLDAAVQALCLKDYVGETFTEEAYRLLTSRWARFAPGVF